MSPSFLMLPASILVLPAGLAVVVFSRRISERGRNEKWAFGGNRIFTVVAGLLMMVLGAWFVYLVFIDPTEPARPRAKGGVTWLWFIFGISMLGLSIYQILNAGRMSEKMRKKKPGPIPVHRSKGGLIILWSVNALFGISLIAGAWPF